MCAGGLANLNLSLILHDAQRKIETAGLQKLEAS